jgi:hypothetical protein
LRNTSVCWRVPPDATGPPCAGLFRFRECKPDDVSAAEVGPADAFDALAHGDKGEWLRQNGFYAAQLSICRKERREHVEVGLEPKTPGQKPKDPRDIQIEQLSREVSKLRKRAELAEALVDPQESVVPGRIDPERRQRVLNAIAEAVDLAEGAS